MARPRRNGGAGAIYHVDLRCTRQEFNHLEIVEDVRFLPGVEGYMGYEPDDMLLWPYFGGNEVCRLSLTRCPLAKWPSSGTRRSANASDGRIGKVEGLVVDGGNHHVSHIVLKEGDFLATSRSPSPSRRKSVDETGVALSIPRHEVDDLPAVDLPRPGRTRSVARSTAGRVRVRSEPITQPVTARSFLTETTPGAANADRSVVGHLDRVGVDGGMVPKRRTDGLRNDAGQQRCNKSRQVFHRGRPRVVPPT